MLCKHQVIGSIPIGSTIFALRAGWLPNERHALWLPRDIRAASLQALLTKISRDEDISLSHGFGRAAIWGICPLFDIVNGFLKSMPWQYRSSS